MRKTTLRRLESLEVVNRAREEREQSSLISARVSVWMIVLAFYLGDLKSDEKHPFDAYTRALKYPSSEEYREDLLCYKGKGDRTRLRKRENDAYHLLFAKVGLHLDTTPRTVLFDAFVTMVDQLPHQWLNWLRFELEGQWCRGLKIPPGANLPCQLSAENFLRESTA
jgi:hypothetical protein